MDGVAAAAAVQAFHWSVWVCLGATAIAVSVIITAAELLAGGERANRKGLRGWSWYCMTKMVQVRSKTWCASSVHQLQDWRGAVRGDADKESVVTCAPLACTDGLHIIEVCLEEGLELVLHD